MELAVAVYEVTRTFPVDERFGLTSQLRRSAVSIPSNIAEGESRESAVDFRRYLAIAKGSNAELQTQLMLARKLGLGAEEGLTQCEGLSAEVQRMLLGLMRVQGEAGKNSEGPG